MWQTEKGQSVRGEGPGDIAVPSSLTGGGSSHCCRAPAIVGSGVRVRDGRLPPAWPHRETCPGNAISCAGVFGGEAKPLRTLVFSVRPSTDLGGGGLTIDWGPRPGQGAGNTLERLEGVCHMGLRGQKAVEKHSSPAVRSRSPQGPQGKHLDFDPRGLRDRGDMQCTCSVKPRCGVSGFPWGEG